MAKIYHRQLRNGSIASIDNVPNRWRAATQALLDADPI